MRKDKKFQKRLKNRKFDLSDGHNNMATKKLDVVARTGQGSFSPLVLSIESKISYFEGSF